VPFRSKAQRAYLYIHHPGVARKFAKETSKRQSKRLPAHVKRRKR